MSAFIKDMLELQFLQNAVIAGILCSIASGVVGTYVVLKRITYIAAAIAHCILGGLGVTRYFSVVYDLPWLRPVYGAVFTAIASALLIGFISLRAKEREDTVISALWSIGMAVGVLFIFKTPGYNEDLMSYLFGNILMVSREDLYLIGALDLVVVGLSATFYNQTVAVCFDEEFARTRGVAVEFYYLLLLCLTALTVVLTVSVVGIIMVIALLSLPVAIASRFFDSVWKIMVAATVLGMIFTLSGLVLSYTPNLPSGALTIVIAGVAYFLTLAWPSLNRSKTQNSSPDASS